MLAWQGYPDHMAVTSSPTSDTALGKPPRAPRWIPLSLRMYVAILVLLGGASALLTWVTYRQEQQLYHRERQALHEIKSWGGHVGTETGGSQWLQFLASQKRLIDGNVLERINFILADGQSLTDAGMAQVDWGGLTRLSGVSFDDTAVTDAGLAHLSGLTKLLQVSVNGTAVTDAGLAHLRELTDLRYLFVCHTGVTDAGLIHLRGMQKLQFLYLDRTAVTDAGLKHLDELTGLKELRLRHTQVTDAGVAELQRTLPNVTIIR